MLVESQMKQLGSDAPDFTLPNTVTDEQVSLQDVKSEVTTVIMFICNHCPYVQHINEQLVAIANDYTTQEVSFIAISSNDATDFPIDAPDQMKAFAEQLGYPFPYLYDESQNTAKAYGATCTPDFFVYDGELKLAYRGRLDAATPGNAEPNDGKDLRLALDAIIAGNTITDDQKPSMGCSIKWKQ